MSLPRYRTTQIPDDRTTGIQYRTCGDDWGIELRIERLDEVSVDCDIATGYPAQMRFGTEQGYGDPLPVKVGETTWDRIADKSDAEINRVQFRNATKGAPARIAVELWGR